MLWNHSVRARDLNLATRQVRDVSSHEQTNSAPGASSSSPSLRGEASSWKAEPPELGPIAKRGSYLIHGNPLERKKLLLGIPFPRNKRCKTEVAAGCHVTWRSVLGMPPLAREHGASSCSAWSRRRRGGRCPLGSKRALAVSELIESGSHGPIKLSSTY